MITWRPLFDLPASLLVLLPTIAFAYPQFTQPSPGASLQLPTIDVEWQDSGSSPLISELTAYTLILMVGGNKETDMRTLQTFTSNGLFSTTGNTATGNISAGIAGPLENGFFFKLVSTTDRDTQIINYSDRFSIAGLTGANLPPEINAVTALKGSTQGPTMSRPGGVSSSSISPTPSTTGPHTVFVTTTPSPTSDKALTSQTSTHSGSSSSSPSHNLDIIVGVIFGIAGLISIAVAFFFLRRRRQPKINVEGQDLDPMAKPELPAEGPRKRNTRIGFHELVEADHGMRPPEMDASNIKFELEGDMPPLVEAGSGRLSVSSDAMSTECGTLTSSGSETLWGGSVRHSMI